MVVERDTNFLFFYEIQPGIDAVDWCRYLQQPTNSRYIQAVSNASWNQIL